MSGHRKPYLHTYAAGDYTLTILYLHSVDCLCPFPTHTSGGFNQPGVDASHPDLVAYWKFDEGQGYTVNDATGHGHNLYIAEEPRWQVGNSTEPEPPRPGTGQTESSHGSANRGDTSGVDGGEAEQGQQRSATAGQTEVKDNSAARRKLGQGRQR